MDWYRQLNTYIRSPCANFEDCPSILLSCGVDYATDAAPL